MIQFFSIKIRESLAVFIAAAILMILVGVSGNTHAQTTDKSKNNPYSPSPSRKVKPNPPANVASLVKSGPSDVSFVSHQVKSQPVQESRPTIAETTFKIAKAADLSSRPPTEIYKIGVGDILFVNLKNSPQGSGYFTVRANGTIDFPLAGENVNVVDLTIDTAEEVIASGITLYPNPQVEVKVRQFASHRITVSGLVENPGEKNLQREAMPLFAIRAESGVNAKANRVLITRAPATKAESYDLHDAKTDDVLVYPGNSIDFVGDGSPTGESYFISGEVAATGQKPLTSGLTLYQALITVGAKGDPKKAILRRKNDKGLFTNTEYNLRSIKEGKMLDPILTSGDVIEIRK